VRALPGRARDDLRASRLIAPGGFAGRPLGGVDQPPTGVDDATSVAEPLACVLLRGIPRGRVLVVGWAIGLSSCRRWCGAATRCSPPTRCPTGSSVPAAGGQPADGRWTPPSLRARGIDGALAALEPGGTLLLFSWLVDAAALDFEQVLRRELTLVGSCSATPAAMREAVALLPELDPIPAATMPLERFAEGLELYRSHEAVKVVFTP
jgi:hypothetical protein